MHATVPRMALYEAVQHTYYILYHAWRCTKRSNIHTTYCTTRGAVRTGPTYILHTLHATVPRVALYEAVQVVVMLGEFRHAIPHSFIRSTSQGNHFPYMYILSVLSIAWFFYTADLPCTEYCMVFYYVKDRGGRSAVFIYFWFFYRTCCL